MRLGFLLALFLLSPLLAHFENLPNNKINAWDKLVLEVKYDEETGIASVRGHSHHPNGVVLLITLKNVYEKDLIDRQDVPVQNGFFSHTFGPFVTENKKPAPGYYEVTVWFVHKQQKPEVQQQLNTAEPPFYNCSPPCPIDYQHYQQDVIQIGTDEEIEAEYKGSLKKYKEWFEQAADIEKEAKRYLTKVIRSKARWEAIEAEFDKKREESAQKINSFLAEIEELRASKNLVYFNRVLSEVEVPLGNILQEFSRTKKICTGVIKDERKIQDALKILESYELKEMDKKLKAAIQPPEEEKENKK